MQSIALYSTLDTTFNNRLNMLTNESLLFPFIKIASISATLFDTVINLPFSYYNEMPRTKFI